MTIQQTIKKAGYHPSRIKNVESLFLDPNFWKALHPTLNLTRMDNKGHMTEPWKNLAKSFWDLIMDGGTAEEFFKELKL